MSSSLPLLLDTHIWVNYLNASPVLRRTTVQRIEEARASGNVLVSVISIWEIALLVRLKRLSLHTSVTDWINQALLLPGVGSVTPAGAVTVAVLLSVPLAAAEIVAEAV